MKKILTMVLIISSSLLSCKTLKDGDTDGDTVEYSPWDADGVPRCRDDAATADTGVGTPFVVDMGAYEFSSGGVNSAPSVSVYTPAGAQSADVVITYDLSDPDGDAMTSIDVEYQGGSAGTTWTRAARFGPHYSLEITD